MLSIEELVERVEKIGPSNVCIVYSEEGKHAKKPVYRVVIRSTGEVIADIPARGDEVIRVMKALARRRFDALGLFTDTEEGCNPSDGLATRRKSA